ncbi:hypothetical protein BYT27DRAFT_6902617 [Phlegmacium glaucopus]|nr:hypothetical protein BYT27DRAFT_6902617 [Phlegmacium glaucopus]
MDTSPRHAILNGPESTSVEHESSSNTLITGGNFYKIEKGSVFNYQIHTPTHPTTGTERRGMRKLEKKIAPGAFHNSAERYDPPKCHPKTRTAVLKKIMDWVQGLEDSERRCYFMWLYGPAGAGKSAIAQSIAELCHELKLLAASFFFSRTSAGRNDHSRLIATLTYQLCLSIPEIRTYVEDAVELDPNIFSLSLETQVLKLIIEPLSYFRDNLSRYCNYIHPMLIIIDGLDECASAVYVQRSVLQLLDGKLPIPMFFLVASRPEPDIQAFFTTEPMASITTTLALDDSYLPSSDIRVFIKARFDAIKQDHPLSRQLRKSWPTAVDIDHLVRKSSGQFIYASTVMKYIESPRHWPTDRLEIIFGIMSRGKDTPFAALDELYTYIFSSVGDINKVLEVFKVLLLMKASIRKCSAFIEDLLGLRRDDLKITLIDLHSILDIPFKADAGEIRVLHASLGDFLLDKSRSGDYHINQGHAHANLTQHLIRFVPRTTRNHEISVLHSLSCAIFTVHCVQSYPTAELLDVLWNSSTLTFWTSVYEIPPKKSRASQMSDFFTWLKNNGSSKEGQDLYSHYILTWDQYIRQSLMQLPPLGPLESQHLVFFILLQLRHYYYVHDVFIWIGARYQLSNISSTLNYHLGDFRYCLLLAEFFNDPSRSGPFYLHGDKYASFAITFTKYVIRPASRHSFMFDLERDSSCLSILLSKASYSEELATLLNSKLLSATEAIRPDLARGVAAIVKTYCNPPVLL